MTWFDDLGRDYMITFFTRFIIKARNAVHHLDLSKSNAYQVWCYQELLAEEKTLTC